MASAKRSKRRWGGTSSKDPGDPADYEIPAVAIEILRAHPAYRYVLELLGAPIVDESDRAKPLSVAIFREPAHAGRQHPLTLIAHRLKKSRRHVSEDFFRQTGIRLLDVIQRLAMKRVAIALRATAENPEQAEKIETIARREGYTSGSAMGRRYAELTGETPTEYRRSWRLHRKRSDRRDTSGTADCPPMPDTPI